MKLHAGPLSLRSISNSHFIFKVNVYYILDVVAHVCIPSIEKAKGGGSEYEASLGYMESFLKREQTV